MIFTQLICKNTKLSTSRCIYAKNSLDVISWWRTEEGGQLLLLTRGNDLHLSLSGCYNAHKSKFCICFYAARYAYTSIFIYTVYEKCMLTSDTFELVTSHSNKVISYFMDNGYIDFIY